MSMRSYIFSFVACACLVGTVRAELVPITIQQQNPTLLGPRPTARPQVISRSLGLLASPDAGPRADEAIESAETQGAGGADRIDFGPARLYFEPGAPGNGLELLGNEFLEFDVIPDMGFQDEAADAGGALWPNSGVRVGPGMGPEPHPTSGDGGLVIAPLPPGICMGLATLIVLGVCRPVLNRRGR